jgi:blue copper oxidase
MLRFLLLLSSVFCSGLIFAQNPLAIPPVITGPVYNLSMDTGTVQFLPGTATRTMGINGNLLGPTLIMQRYQQVNMNVTNNLGEQTTLHWHGLHVPANSDGGPHHVIDTGMTWSPTFIVKDYATTAWYHPHLHHKTNEHVQKGIAGFIIVKDSIEGALNLPRTYGVDDIPLAVQTKAFDNDNQIIIFSHLDVNLMVNGTFNPYFEAPAQVVRLRLLNGSSDRYYNFGFDGNKVFHVIGSDGGLLDAPVALTRLQVAPGERYEVLIDLAPFQGQSFYLKSFGSELPNAIYGAAQPGMGPNQTIPNYTSNPLNGNDFNVMRIDVVAPTANPITTIPTTLITNAPWPSAQASSTRNFIFNVAPGGVPLTGPYHINNQTFDMMRIDFNVIKDDTEIWSLTNQTPIGHPFHLHGFPFYVLDINGVAPPAHLRGRKDMIHVPAGQGVVRFIVKYEDYYDDHWPFMYHCHMLSHEEGGMMGQYRVLAPCDFSTTSLPQNQSVFEGDAAFFAVSVDSGNVSFQWQTFDGTNYIDLVDGGQFSGVNNDTLFVSNVTLANHNQIFRCIISSAGCTEQTTEVYLFVSLPCLLNIISQPVSDTVLIGDAANFTVTANDPNATYQWQTDIGFGFQNLSNAGQYSGVNTATLTVSNVSLLNNNQLFRCLVGSPACSFNTDLATLYVSDPSGFVINDDKVFMNVYPNPTKSILHVDLSENSGITYELINLLGAVVQRGSLNNLSNLLDLSDLTRGVYLFRIPQTGQSIKIVLD